MITGYRVFLHPGCRGTATANRAPGSRMQGQEIGPGAFGDPPTGIIFWDLFYNQFGYKDEKDLEIPPAPENPYGYNAAYMHSGYDKYDGIYKYANVSTDDWYRVYGPLSFGLTPDYDWLDAIRLERMEQLMHTGTEAVPQGDTVTVSEGDNQITNPEIWSVDVSVLIRGPAVNNWYGLQDTGKFGWAAAHYDGLWWGQQHYLNFDAQRIVFEQA